MRHVQLRSALLGKRARKRTRTGARQTITTGSARQPLRAHIALPHLQRCAHPAQMNHHCTLQRDVNSQSASAPSLLENKPVHYLSTHSRMLPAPRRLRLRTQRQTGRSNYSDKLCRSQIGIEIIVRALA